MTLTGEKLRLGIDSFNLGVGRREQEHVRMVQPATAQSITIQLGHDLVQIGPYKLSYWEAVRGVPMTFHATVGVGLGLASILHVSLQPRIDYYLNTPSPFMGSDLAAVDIPAILSVSSQAVPILTTPIYPGLVRLRITAKVGGAQIQMHSVRGTGYEFDNWFYVIEKEAAFLLALAWPKPQ